jgi:hypothetical protein
MVKYILFIFLIAPVLAKSQKVEKIFVNLYTDSLKKGTYNYINVDGQLSNGKYIPLDTTQLNYWASDGKFVGNCLLIDRNFSKNKIDFKVSLKSNPALVKEFTMYIKKIPDPQRLKTTQELLDDIKRKKN